MERTRRWAIFGCYAFLFGMVGLSAASCARLAEGFTVIRVVDFVAHLIAVGAVVLMIGVLKVVEWSPRE